MSETEPLLGETDIKIANGHKRHLGHLENYFALLQRQELYGNFSIGCKLNKGISYVELAKGLRLVAIENPLMIHTMVPEATHGTMEELKKYYRSEVYLKTPFPKHDYMEVLDSLNINDVVINEQSEVYGELLNEIKEQFVKDNGKISETVCDLASKIRIPAYLPDKPNWRILCLSRESNKDNFDTLLFISNHCCADAMTGINLFKDIVDTINADTSGDNGNDTLEIWNYERDCTIAKKLPKPITERINYVPNILSFIWLIITTVVNGIFNYKSPCKETERVTATNPQKCYQSIVKFTPSEVTQIKQRINEQKCTMTAMLQTALCVSLKNHGIFNNRKMNEITFDVTVPNNTRKSIPDELATEQYKYGANVGGLHYSYLISSFDESKFWSLSKYYNSVLRTADYLVGLGSLMLDFVVQNKNIDSMIADSYLNKKRGGIILSNVGFINTTTQESQIEIEDLLFMQNLGVLNFTYGVNIVTTSTGGMNICMSAVEGAVKSQEDFMSLGDELHSLIMNKCTANK